MQQVRSSYFLIAFVAVLLIGFYTVDIQPNQASVLSLPDFSSDNTVEETDEVNKENKSTSSPTLSKLNDEIVNVAEKTKSTVVTVTVTQTVEAPQNPLSRFFGDPRNQEPREYQRQGQGSGVIVSEDGYILTNNHVVENASEVEVQLYSDKRHTAEVIGTDPRTDIAVLKINANNLDVIKLGNSNNVRVGEIVLAIGSPLESDLAHSVSMGIISATDRTLGILEDRGGYENFIQTDAAINPGNSGGALINMDGDLIGVNTAIASRSGGSDGIGFAVPVDIAKRVMKSIIENGRVVRGYLGITRGGQVDNTMARALGLDKPYGIIVGSVEDDGPADEAGLQEGDVIQTINGKPIKNWNLFRTSIATSSPGAEIKLGVNRDGEQLTVNVTLGELPSELAMNEQPQEDRSLEKQLGFRVQNLTPEIAQKLELNPNQNGVIVAQISQRSEAYRQGLRQGYVITEVDRQPISDVSDFREAITNLAEQEKDIVLLRVIAGENSELIAFEL
jgi:serine protease Do